MSGEQLLANYSRLTHSNPEHGKYVVINWCIGNTCNYSCSYCPVGLHDGSLPWPKSQDVIEFCQKAISHYKTKKIYFEFTGGEVTLWKELPQVLEFLKSADCRVGIISNGARSLDLWNKILPFLDHVCLSFHPESAKADHFLEVVKLCADKIRTHVNFMMHPKYFPECLALAYKVKELDSISIAIQPLTDDMGSDLKKVDPSLFRYSSTQSRVIDTQNAFLAKQIKHIKKFESYRGAMDMVQNNGQKSPISPQRFISAKSNSWIGWNCAIGVEQIVVDMSGDIFRGWCKVGGRVGHILDKNLSLPTTTVVCNKKYCHCNLDIMTTKSKRPTQQKFSWKNLFKKAVHNEL